MTSECKQNIALKMATKVFNLHNKVCYRWRSWYWKRLKHEIISRDYSKYYHNIEPMPTKYGGISNVTLLPGVGIGPELMKATREVLSVAEAPIHFEEIRLSSGEGLSGDFHNVLTSIKRNKVALKGNIEVRSKDPLVTSRNAALRQNLDLYVYVLHCQTFPGMANLFGDVNVIVIRQNTEGEYLMLEHEPVKGKVESLKIVTRYNSERIADYAFRFAVEHKRKRICITHSADIQVLTEGIFLEAALSTAKKYPEIEHTVLEVGVLACSLIRNPTAFDVILATNLNGSMISNFLNGMIGGPALSCGVNTGAEGIRVFEPGARNKGSSIVGQGVANPIAMLLSAIELLKYLGHHRIGATIKDAIYKNLVIDRLYTPDLGGKATTAQITENIIQHIKNAIGHDEKRRPKKITYPRICQPTDSEEKC